MPLSEKLAELSKLSDNWDFRGSAAPSDAAIQTVRNLTAVPLGSGGLQLEMHSGDCDIEIEIDTLGKVIAVSWARKMSDEQWPPNSGIPEKRRFKKANKLEWGETPFDDLSRAELLRLVQAYHSATVASRSVMAMIAEALPSPYWGSEGSGGRALAKANFLLRLAGEEDPDPASEKIYRSFFRTADALLFPYLKEVDKWSNWGVNDRGEMCAPMREEEGWRPIEWRDVLPIRS